MVFDKFSRFLVLFFAFSVCILSSYATYPDLQFSESSFPSGEVDISFQASSGTQVELFLNDQFVQRQDIIADPLVVELTGSIQDLTVPLGAQVTIRNNDPGRLYSLSIDSSSPQTLAFGDYLTYTATTEGDVLFEDVNEGVTRVITGQDQLTTVTFEGVQDYLVDGTNLVRFDQKYPLGSLGNTETYEFSVSHEKFSNSIVITSITNTTNEKIIDVTGYVTDADSQLFYILNFDGPIVNTGSLTEIPLEGNEFNITLRSGLREGENQVRFISTDQFNNNVFNGETSRTVLIDTVPPFFAITSEFREYTNENSLRLNISTDATSVQYTFNGVNESVSVVNDSALLSLTLELGRNNLTMIAVDDAGNMYKEAKNIFYDNEDPSLIRGSLEPAQIFDDNTARFFFEKIEGQTNKPNVFMTVFTLTSDARDGDGRAITCQDYENLFSRNLGDIQNDREFGPEVDLDDRQLSLLSYVYKKEEFTTDSEGHFDVIIGLQERDLDRRDAERYQDDLEDDDSPRVRDVPSQNDICFVMEDRFGNKRVESHRVTLDAGNTLWRPGEITTIPNTLYAAEIEQVGDVRAGTGRTEFGMIARFTYIGAGEVNNINRVVIRSDRQGAEDSRFIDPDSARMNYRFDKVTNELLVYIPVQIDPLNIDPSEYPSDLDLAFEMRLTYDIDGVGIPVDIENPVYFQTSVNIETPFDHTKWLTPETIDDAIEFFNGTIELTERLTRFTQTAAVGGVLACTGMQFWYSAQVAIAQSSLEGDELLERLSELDEKLYTVCDRVACSASPQQCGAYNSGQEIGGDALLPIDNNQLTGNSLNEGALSQASILADELNPNDVIVEFDSVTMRGYCTYGTDGDGNEIPGVLISGRYTEYVDQVNELGQPSQEEIVGRMANECVRANYGDFDFSSDERPTGNPTAIDLASSTGACYSEGSPHYDQTRCWLPGIGSQPGWDPSDNVIESLRCGCITDTYSHLNNMLKIQEGIVGCLEQAKVGDVKGSYCERLLSQAVCDVATSVVFDTLGQNPGRFSTDGEGDDNRGPNFVEKLLGGLSESNRVINDRYSDSFLAAGGLGTRQITNKVCLGALTGDFSVLTENILTAIDQNEVDPVFGPAFPESRMLGYNPLTGEVTMQYRFTYGVVSGGQDVVTRVQFVCDKQSPGGDLCPDDYVTSDNPATGSRLNVRTLNVRRGDAVSDTVVAIDESARFRYNILRLEHEYTLDGERRTRDVEYSIAQKGEFMLASCYFTGGVLSAGAGISCDSLFNDDALVSLYSIADDTNILPENYAFFSNNPLYVNLHYDVRYDQFEDDNQDLDLVYRYTCPTLFDVPQDPTFGIADNVLQGSGSVAGSKPVYLFSVPDVGRIDEEFYTVFFTPQTLQIGTLDRDSNFFIKVSRAKSDEGTGPLSGARFTDETSQVSSTSTDGKTLPLMTGLAANHDPLYVPITINDFDRDQRISLRFDSKINEENVLLQIVSGRGTDPTADDFDEVIYIDFDGRPEGFVDSQTPNMLRPGTCNLDMRLVPSSQSIFVTSSDDNFYGDTSESDDIILDDELARESNNIFSTTFTIDALRNDDQEGETDSPRQPFGFEVIYPLEDQTVCANDFQGIRYILMTYNNENPSLLSLSSSIRLERTSLSDSLNLDYGQIEVTGEDFRTFNFENLELFSVAEDIYDVQYSYTLSDSERTVKEDSYTFKIDTRENCGN